MVKGGRRFAFAALVVVGDQKGRVGYGAGKAREVPEAIRKATERAKRGMIRVPMKEGRTLHHDIEGRYGAGKVILRRPSPAPASSPAARCARCSRRWASATWWRSRSAAATRTTWSRRPSPRWSGAPRPRSVANRRGKKVSELFGRRDAAPPAAGRRPARRPANA